MEEHCVAHSDTSPSPDKHNTQMLISTVQEQKSHTCSSLMNYCVIWLCSVISAEIQERKDVEILFFNKTDSPIHGLQKYLLIISLIASLCLHYLSVDWWITAKSAEENSIWDTLKMTTELNGKVKVKCEKSSIVQHLWYPTQIGENDIIVQFS